MSAKTLVRSLILLVFAVHIPNAHAQDNEAVMLGFQTVMLNSLEDNTVHYYEGQVHLKDNRVLSGSISLNHVHNSKYSVLLRQNEGCTFITNEDIETVVLFQNVKDQQAETRFVAIDGKDKLFREIFKKDDDNAIYDSLEKPFDGRIMSGIYIKDNGNLTSIYNFWSSGPKKDLINYINERDDKKYKRRDFKSLEELFALL